ncbi:hypothetical protein Misp04_24670 [Micromonospora sp. NBRC 101691]|nr:hypothetical protein Misp04_24670 [Micromonospora sp. NBRC 101691]
MVFLVISRLLAPDPGFAGSPSYFDFVAAGLVFMLVLHAASTQLTARISREQRAGTLEMLVAQPVPAWALALGLTGYPMLFALLRVAVYLTVLALFLDLDTGGASWIGVAVVLVAACAAMAGVGIALMAVTVLTGHGDAAARLLVVALSFVSGTYFPVTVLPAGLEWVSAALPTRVAPGGTSAPGSSSATCPHPRARPGRSTPDHAVAARRPVPPLPWPRWKRRSCRRCDVHRAWSASPEGSTRPSSSPSRSGSPAGRDCRSRYPPPGGSPARPGRTSPTGRTGWSPPSAARPGRFCGPTTTSTRPARSRDACCCDTG